MNLIEPAIALEDAKQRAEYWLVRWTADRGNQRFLFRYVCALRACDRLTNDLCTP
jgi:hypothetical protein